MADILTIASQQYSLSNRNDMNQDTTKKMIVALQEVLSQEINTFDALQKEHSNDSVWVEFCQHNKQILHQSFTAQINYYTKSLCLKKTS